MLLGFPVGAAVGSSLFLNGVTAVSGSWVYGRRGLIDPAVSWPVVIASALAAPIGALGTERVPESLVRGLLGGILLLAAWRAARPGREKAMGGDVGRPTRILAGAAVGTVAGLGGGLLGVGGGVFVVVLLVSGAGIPTRVAAATSLFAVAFSSWTGFAVHATRTDLPWRLLLPAAVLCLIGGQLGSRWMSGRMSGRTHRWLLAGVLGVIGARLLQLALR